MIRLFAGSTSYHSSQPQAIAHRLPNALFVLSLECSSPIINPQVKKQSHHIRGPSISTTAALGLRRLSISHLRHVEVHRPDRRVHGIWTGTLDVGIPGAL